jgi:hypothetical protein
LIIEHPEYDRLSERLDAVPSVRTIHVWTFVLQRRVGAPRIEPPLSQLRGERLPPMAGQRILAREIERDELGDYDVLRLILLYANGREAKLVSRLLSYEGGEFVVHWVRVPLSELPHDPVLREHYWLRAGRFTRINLSPGKLRAYDELLQDRRDQSAAPGAGAELGTVEVRLRRMQEAGVLRSRGRGGPRA